LIFIFSTLPLQAYLDFRPFFRYVRFVLLTAQGASSAHSASQRIAAVF
jgi:hypothetical protein